MIMLPSAPPEIVLNKVLMFQEPNLQTFVWDLLGWFKQHINLAYEIFSDCMDLYVLTIDSFLLGVQTTLGEKAVPDAVKIHTITVAKFHHKQALRMVNLNSGKYSLVCG